MKTLPLAALILLAGVTGLRAAVASAAGPGPIASEIAGFVSLEVPPAASSGEARLSLKSIGLLRPVEYRGTAEILRGRSLIDRQAVWSNAQFSAAGGTADAAQYYVEIATGPHAGAVFDILKSDAARGVLTLGQSVPAKLTGPVGYRIRRHWTLGSLFGAANEIGLTPGDENAADLVQIYNGKGFEKFYYQASPSSPGWRKAGAGDGDQGTHKVFPDDGLVILRKGTDAAATLLKGIVKTDRTVIPVQRGLNYLANVYQVPLTLASANLFTGNAATGLRPGPNSAAADLVLIYQGATYETYYFQRNPKLGNGWRRLSAPTVDAGATPIAVGSAFAIQRRGTVGFNWIAPAPKANP